MLECLAPGYAPSSRMSETPPLSSLANGYGDRLTVARKALGKSAKALAAEMGVSPQRWSHWERERHPPDFYVMLALRHRYSISLDWIYAGDWRGLPGHILQRFLSQSQIPGAPRALVIFRAQFLAGTEGFLSSALHDDRRPL
jgi:transcriptional regulator with XRE-family HTH domain